MIKAFLRVCLIFLFLPICVHSADFFLPTDIGSSARMIALGGIEGFSSEADSIFENPAGLYRVQKFSSSIFSTTFFNEVHFNSFSFARKLRFGTLGFGFMSTSVGDIAITRVSDSGKFVPESYVDYYNVITKITYEQSLLEKLHFGVSFVHVEQDLGTVRGQGDNLDLGLIYSYNNLEGSLSAKNVLSSSKVLYSNSESLELPLHLAASFKGAYRLFDVSAQIKQSNSRFLPSVAVTLRPGLGHIFELYAGYKSYLVLSEVRNNFTMGLGLNLDLFRFYYAYETSEFPEFDNKNYFSIGFYL